MTAIYRMGARVASNPSPSQGYWRHGQGPSKPVMPSYGGFGGYGVSQASLADLETDIAYFEQQEEEGAEANDHDQVREAQDALDDLYAEWDEVNAAGGEVPDIDDDLPNPFDLTPGIETSATNLPAAISKVSSAKVTDGRSFELFTASVDNAYNIETGKTLDYSFSIPSDALGIAPLFGELSTAAKAGSKTVGAITKAAGWFYCNTEKDALKAAGETSKYNAAVKYCSGGGSTTSSGTKGGSKPPAGSSVGGAVKGGKPFYKQTWFFVSMGVLGAAVVFGVPVGLMVKKKKRKSQF